MKLLSYILAVYLILLAAIPCCAFDNCPDDKTTQAVNHEKGDTDCGNCSPFFSCEGCATATISAEPLQIDFFSMPLVPVYSNHIQQQLSEVDYDFWQPPKIG